MLDILEYFGYDDVDKEFVRKRSNLFELVIKLKHIPKEIDKRYFLLEKSFEMQAQFLTYVVKDKNALQYMNLLKFHHNNSIIPFKFDESSVDIGALVLISYETNTEKTVDLCPEIFRPYFVCKTDSNDFVSNYRQILDNNFEINRN